MKKLLLLLFLVLAGQTLVFGQFELRPAVGITQSSLKDFTEADFNGEVGYSFGIDLMYGSRVYIQPGIHFESDRNSIYTDFGTFGGTYSLKVNKIRIPLLVGYKLFNSDTDHFFNVRVSTGPSISLVTSAEDENSPLIIGKDDLKSSVLGWNGGVGVDILVFFLDVNYQFGLTDVFEERQFLGIDNQNSKNNIFYLNAGIRLKL